VPPFWERANCDTFAPGLATQHLTGAVEAELIGDDEARDHGLTETPACFNQALIGTSDRVFREHNTGDIRVK
jgi:adenosine deaminase